MFRKIKPSNNRTIRAGAIGVLLLTTALMAWNANSLVRYRDIALGIDVGSLSARGTNDLRAYQTYLKSSGLADSSKNNVDIVSGGGGSYVFLVHNSGSQVRVAVTGNPLSGTIETVSIVRTEEPRMTILAEGGDGPPAAMSNWNISHWITTAGFSPDFSEASSSSTTPVGVPTNTQLLSLADGTVQIPAKDFSVLDAQNTTDTGIIFRDNKNNINYRLTVENIDTVYSSNTAVSDLLNYWKDDNENLFKSIDGSGQTNDTQVFVNASIDGTAEPAAMLATEQRGRASKRESFILVVFIPEKNKKLILIANRNSYSIESSATTTESVETSNTSGAHEDTAATVSSNEAYSNPIENYPLVRDFLAKKIISLSLK